MKVDGDVCGRGFTGTRLEPCVFEIEGSELGQQQAVRTINSGMGGERIKQLP